MYKQTGIKTVQLHDDFFQQSYNTLHNITAYNTSNAIDNTQQTSEQ